MVIAQQLGIYFSVMLAQEGGRLGGVTWRLGHLEHRTRHFEFAAYYLLNVDHHIAAGERRFKVMPLFPRFKTT
jgi:hypothetical protein